MWSFHSHALEKALPGSARFLRSRPLGEALDVLLTKRDEHQRDRAYVAARRLRGDGQSLRSKSARSGAGRLESALPGLAAAGARGASKGKYEVRTTPLEPKFDIATRTVSFESRSSINRRLSDMRWLLDPRAWGLCSDFFDPDRTYRMKMVDGRPVRDRRGHWVRDDGPEPYGDSWAGLLRERFDGPGVSVDNLLAIDFRAADDRVIVDYALYVSERCSLGPFVDVGGLHKNCGTVEAVAKGGTTVVDVVKTLRFHDFTPGDPGEWVDLGDALSLVMAVMGVVLVDDKIVLKLTCTRPKGLA